LSGIVGIFNPDGRPVGRVALERMAKSVAHRGPDGAGIWLHGSVGLGHRTFHSTPESFQSEMPLADENGDFCLTLDGRIDNRDDVKKSLLAQGFRLRNDSDAEFVLRAYECWGEDCPAKLIGDFAFAIWDHRRQRLFCARDFIGIKPFYYFFDGRVFLFSSEPHSLLEFAEVPALVNEGMVGEYLTVNISNRDETLFEKIRRLPPAHSLAVESGKLSLRRYWDIDSARQIRYRTEAEYGEHFLSLFREAVKCRLRVHGGIAADLSGGLDSSSIVSVAQSLIQSGAVAEKGFEIYSQVFPGQEYDESDYIKAVVERWKIGSTLVLPGRLRADRFIEHARRYKDFPGYPNGSIVDPILDLAQQKACRVNLKGVGGDDVFTISQPHYSIAMRKFRFWKAWQDLRLAVEGQVVSPIPPARLYLRAALRRLFEKRLAAVGKPTDEPLPNWIEPEFARRIELADRLRQKASEQQFADADQECLYSVVFDSWILHNIEVEERASTFYGLEQRQPFRDRRIVEFCCAIPAEQREKNGLTRVALRTAMRGLLPEKVRRRRTKGSFNHLFGEALRAAGGAKLFRSLAIAKRGWVIGDKLQTMSLTTERWLNGDTDSPQHIWPLWIAYGIELWANSESAAL
jgi:asparagine synthase (glutamine-hydrolysing)